MTQIATTRTNGKKADAVPKAERRQQLIDATIESIAKFGLSGTTMNTIAREAGLSIGLAYFYFSTKQVMLEETLRYLAEEDHQFWKKSFAKADLAPEAKLHAIVSAHFHPSICTPTKIAVWYGFFGESRARASYRQLIEEIDADRIERSTELCAEIIAEGGYENIDPRAVAMTLEGLYDGFWLNILMYPKMFNRSFAVSSIQSYLAGLFPRHFKHPSTPAGKG